MKIYNISKHIVAEAYERVRKNGGAAGVDGMTVATFEENLKGNLYKIWNRMSSGSYMAPAVRMVEIPKSDGKVRCLGIPTVGDRVAQMTAKMYLEPELEPHFHKSSYGYRPNKSAHDALAETRKRCWKYDWVIDLDIKGFFDNLDHDLVMKAVKKHTQEGWLLLYIERWLKAPVQNIDGELEVRTKGTPQGGVISPLIANLFLHYAFDTWMERNYPNNPFERYADDVVVHCRSLEEAEELKRAIESRMKECSLELHPKKTKIVYCKDDDRPGGYRQTSFDFLGYTFRARRARSKHGKYFTGFLPAISDKAKKAIRRRIRDWKVEWQCLDKLENIAKAIGRTVIGWVNYYGKFYKSELISLFEYLNRRLVRWAIRKYKRLKGSLRKGVKWLIKIMTKERGMFAHWKLGYRGISGQ